jgi:hypothetical protein
MTTRLTKPVRRLVDTIHHGPLVVTLERDGVSFREKGRRQHFLLPHGMAFQRAVDLEVHRRKREKLAARRAKARGLA